MALTDSLTAGYNLDGNSNDVLGSNNGTDTSMAYSSGKIGSAADFTAPNSKIVLPASVLISSTAFSVSFWIKTTSTASEVFIDNDIFPSVRCFAIRINNSSTAGKVSIYRFDGTQTFINEVEHATGGFNDGNWHHGVITFSTTNGIRIYKDNGTATTDANTTANYAASSNNVTLGQQCESTVAAFTGSLDMVYFWSRELTSTEVAELWNGGAGLQYPFVASTFTPRSSFIM